MLEHPRHLILVTGPRQTGKTTAVRQALTEIDIPSLYVEADQLSQPAFLGLPEDAVRDGELQKRRDVYWVLRIWEAARREAARSRRGLVLVIDEIQQVRNWARAVKSLWDEDRFRNLPLRVVILGSAPLLMQWDLGDSLVGRFEPLYFTNWSFPQMSEAFGYSLDQYLYFGGSPGSAAIHGEVRRREYVREALVRPVLQRDVVGITRIRKPMLLKTLLGMGVRYSGQIVSYNKMLGQLQEAGSIEILARYLDLLSDVGLMTGLEMYSSRLIQMKRSSPKLIVLNPALLGAFSDLTFEQAKADRQFWGRLVETAVGAHLFNSGRRDYITVCYWRNRSLEVDFVLKGNPSLVAIEVKSGERIRSKQGMHKFCEKFPHAKQIYVGSNGIPLTEFLSAPAAEWLRYGCC